LVLAVNIRVPALETFIAEIYIVFHAHEGSLFFRTASTSSKEVRFFAKVSIRVQRGESFFDKTNAVMPSRAIINGTPTVRHVS
jgi:hypothetical protein